jgi:two-component system sensor histidine kinase YesM
MIRRINSLIEEVYLAQIKEKEAELLALQQQINPHFLYNTLDSIAWMSMAYKAEDIRYMVMSLASMMRYSLNEGNNYISVRDELEQVRNYVGIQEIRYDNKFTTAIKCDTEALDYKIIKLIIQPLVENAIVHGFKDTGKFGNIEINVQIVGQDLKIEVINDGDEIDLDKVKKLLEPETDEKPKHYGLRNVNDRLIKSFGKKSAIKFSVEHGKTVARIKISLNQLFKNDAEDIDSE